MNFNRIPTRLSTHFVCDPYSTLMHYRRTFKFLQALKTKPNCRVLCLGNNNQININWPKHFEGLTIVNSAVSANSSILSAASVHYSLILCLDPVLFAKHLHHINVPVLGVCTPREIHEHPEILKVIDYLLPSPSTRTDAALRQLLARDFLDDDGAGEAAQKQIQE
ncbi:hypothetical protein BESB_008550 [Besnoitia besnoiti]|uniref:Uncharacterized protein n=1 Tax=Besnoitia besnoiti TaxID=94643 RepID=A0A2A9MQH7_BESBE|nr:hypothetical protein BESB_008550 [Besnoitia besnoiti]PFH38513.1 hypothetical protein BESB_008550 [Besnoitia besnoiti]